VGLRDHLGMGAAARAALPRRPRASQGRAHARLRGVARRLRAGQLTGQLRTGQPGGTCVGSGFVVVRIGRSKSVTVRGNAPRIPKARRRAAAAAGRAVLEPARPPAQPDAGPAPWTRAGVRRSLRSRPPGPAFRSRQPGPAFCPRQPGADFCPRQSRATGVVGAGLARTWRAAACRACAAAAGGRSGLGTWAAAARWIRAGTAGVRRASAARRAGRASATGWSWSSWRCAARRPVRWTGLPRASSRTGWGRGSGAARSGGSWLRTARWPGNRSAGARRSGSAWAARTWWARGFRADGPWWSRAARRCARTP
jgi:hypothetical protein